jgi:hypothetical protein
MAVGFPKMTVENGDQDPNTGLFRVTAGTLLERRSGTVTELCLPDTTMYRGPGFLVDCPFGAGMSGGPVLEVRPGGDVMTVRGLITGDLTDQSEEQGRGSGLRAFASMLTPALIMKTRVGIDGVEGAVKVIDLVRHGFIDERGGALEHVQIVELPDGQFTLRWAREW